MIREIDPFLATTAATRFGIEGILAGGDLPKPGPDCTPEPPGPIIEWGSTAWKNQIGRHSKGTALCLPIRFRSAVLFAEFANFLCRKSLLAKRHCRA
jgi:hypothetical protein